MAANADASKPSQSSSQVCKTGRYNAKVNLFSHFLVVVHFAETVGLSEVRPVELMQDQAQCILADYVRHRYNAQSKF